MHHPVLAQTHLRHGGLVVFLGKINYRFDGKDKYKSNSSGCDGYGKTGRERTGEGGARENDGDHKYSVDALRAGYLAAKEISRL